MVNGQLLEGDLLRRRGLPVLRLGPAAGRVGRGVLCPRRAGRAVPAVSRSRPRLRARLEALSKS